MSLLGGIKFQDVSNLVSFASRYVNPFVWTERLAPLTIPDSEGMRHAAAKGGLAGFIAAVNPMSRYQMAVFPPVPKESFANSTDDQRALELLGMAGLPSRDLKARTPRHRPDRIVPFDEVPSPMDILTHDDDPAEYGGFLA